MNQSFKLWTERGSGINGSVKVTDMKVLFLNNSSLITYGLISGFQPIDELRFIPVHQTDWAEKLVDLFSFWKPDFAFADGCSIIVVHKKLTAILKSYHIPFVYWAIDDPPEWHNMSLPLSRNATLVLTPAEECLSFYQRHHLKAYYFHFAANPAFHRPHSPAKRYSADIALVGNYYSFFSQRHIGLQIILAPLLDKAYTLRVYGNESWLHNRENYRLPSSVYQGYLDYWALPMVYSSAKIVLGLHSVIDSPTMMSMRTFEALGCRAFFLTHWTPAIESMFENHIHLVWSKSPDETAELVRFYLQREDLRQKIALQGQREVYEKHTYSHRLNSARSLLESLRGNV